MFIHEAIRECCHNEKGNPKRHIKRKKWDAPISGGTPRVCPSDSPDGCAFYSPASKGWFRGWQPTKEDLIADDWEVVSMFDYDYACR